MAVSYIISEKMEGISSHWLKITLCLDRCLASKRGNVSCYYCEKPKPLYQMEAYGAGYQTERPNHL